MQGEIDERDIATIADLTASRVAKVEAFDLTVGAPSFTPEAIRFDPTPTAPASKLREALRNAIGEVWAEVPEAADGFEPHITIGYGNRDADASKIIAAIEQAEIEPITIHITHADLILLGRDSKVYTWSVTRRLPLAA
jgi:2'-5' RNA ligase